MKRKLLETTRLQVLRADFTNISKVIIGGTHFFRSAIPICLCLK